jgi:hypothetical protein
MLQGIVAQSKPIGPSYTLESRVGRVMEARVFRLQSPEEANIYAHAVAALVAKMPRTPAPVLCADHRPVVIYPQEVADRLTQLFQDMNSQIGRIAIIVARTNATLSLQLHRIVREAGYEHRRVFHAARDAHAHLASVLDPPEAERVRAFLAEIAG